MKATTKHTMYALICLGLFLFASSIDSLLLSVGM